MVTVTAELSELDLRLIRRGLILLQGTHALDRDDARLTTVTALEQRVYALLGQLLSGDRRCLHHNDEYGQCVLTANHPPVHNGSGIHYAHRYTPHGAFGTLDVHERIDTPERTHRAAHRGD